tara:strand:+ start:2276 stop:3265 length:990 start_codon:yes stop_codon:yes gene_type:complete
MIIKNYELKKNISKYKIYLLYGSNEGFKNQIINDFFIKDFKGEIERTEEQNITNNYENYLSSLMNKSFFDEKKIIIISRVSEKIIKFVNDLLDKDIQDISIILNSNNLEKKSKLRSLFEKEKKLGCIPFYADDNKTLSFIATKFLRENKIPISQEGINLIIDRCVGDRKNLENELEKLKFFFMSDKKISLEEIIKLTNLAENFTISELVDNCLSKNRKTTIKILNENNYSSEDCVTIIRTFLLKSKRILNLKMEINKNNDLDHILSGYKPPIFWKDKPVVKKQLQNWSLKSAKNLIISINDVELLIKKNSSNSLNILSDFIMRTATISS